MNTVFASCGQMGLPTVMSCAREPPVSPVAIVLIQPHHTAHRAHLPREPLAGVGTHFDNVGQTHCHLPLVHRIGVQPLQCTFEAHSNLLKDPALNEPRALVGFGTWSEMGRAVRSLMMMLTI